MTVRTRHRAYTQYLQRRLLHGGIVCPKDGQHASIRIQGKYGLHIMSRAGFRQTLAQAQQLLLLIFD